MIKNAFAPLLFISVIASFMTGCSGDEDYIFEHGPAGPNTEKTLKTLPEGLRPDAEKASHTDDTLEPTE
ncbi:MAG: hypothetical protein K9G26_06425 [Emcibacter sp.]|nr:hypothetical protein [Emcibacter sp.]